MLLISIIFIGIFLQTFSWYIAQYISYMQEIVFYCGQSEQRKKLMESFLLYGFSLLKSSADFYSALKMHTVLNKKISVPFADTVDCARYVIIDYKIIGDSLLQISVFLLDKNMKELGSMTRTFSYAF